MTEASDGETQGDKQPEAAPQVASSRVPVIAVSLAALAIIGAALGPAFAADVHLRMWVKGQKPAFDSFGACRPADGGLSCEGWLSAAESDAYKTHTDGVHRDCRIGTATTGAFGVVAQPDGLTVTIQRRLELVPEPYDGGPFLYVSPGNAENHAFALKPAPESACQ